LLEIQPSGSLSLGIQSLGSFLGIQPSGSVGCCVLKSELDVRVELVNVTVELVQLLNCATEDGEDVVEESFKHSEGEGAASLFGCYF